MSEEKTVMPSDIEIAHSNEMASIRDVFSSRGLIEGVDYDCYGKYKAKVTEECLKRHSTSPSGKLVLVTAISPTPAGEGKTTTAIGLVDGLNLIGVKATLAVREPSMGPVFGVKGGACGGGYAQVQPMEDINLHFMGDFHAIGAANNLLCALVDNSIKFGNPLCIDKVKVRRCVDMNDRELRNCVIGLGGSANGVPREEQFQITVATEMMAIVCLAKDVEDLKVRIGGIVIGTTHSGEDVLADDLGCVDAVALLLKDAIRPNLAQTLEHNPVVIHGGPFANIAHGCNSVRATKLAMALGDVTVTEAGFGADLGAEKFIDIKCRSAGIFPDCLVIVASIRALKYNGGANKADLAAEDVGALMSGLYGNFLRHCSNLLKFGVPIVAALNVFDTDSPEEIQCFRDVCDKYGIRYQVNTSFKDGGKGAQSLAIAVDDAIHKSAGKTHQRFLYPFESTVTEKIVFICCDYYGAERVQFSKKAKAALKDIEGCGFPVCVAKTQYSFSDDPKALNAPTGFTVNVTDVSLSNGAQFVVAYLGDVMTMPGLPKNPAAMSMTFSEDGVIGGLF